jgi:hypothetical protein
VDPPLAPPDGVSPVWLTLVSFEVPEPDAGEVGVDGLVLAGVDGDVVAFGVGVVVGLGAGLVAQGDPVALAVVLPVVLVLAEAVELALLVAVALAVAVAVLVALVLSLGLVLLLAGLALVLLLAGLVTVLAEGTLGVADLVVLLAEDGAELDGHAVTFALAGLLEMLLGLTPPTDELIALPDPAAP